MILELLFYPGVIIHELTHFIACVLLGVKVTKIKFGLKEAYVQHLDVNNWKTIIIALTPFILSNVIALTIIYFTLKIKPAFYVFGLVLWLALTIIYHSVPSRKDVDNVDKKIIGIYKNISSKNVLLLVPLFILNTVIFIPLKIFTFILIIFNKYPLLKIILIIAVFQISFLFL